MRILTLLLALALAGPAEFDRTVYDLGEISIKDGPQKCGFTVTNVSEEPFLIVAVVTSCGCTRAKWTRTEIAPGDKGEISIEYSNEEGPSIINKVITVYVSTERTPYILHLRGKVTNRKDNK